MESKEQGFKNQIIKDLNAGRISRELVGLILGEGGYRLSGMERYHIFEWMARNTDEWYVSEDGGGTFVVFAHTPFHQEDWDNVEYYKRVMCLMFGDQGTKDFLCRRCSMEESFRIRKNIKDLEAGSLCVKEGDFVRAYINDASMLGLVTSITERFPSDKEYVIRVLSGGDRGEFRLIKRREQINKVDPKEATKELIRQKEEWKNKKREEFREARRVEFLRKYGNIDRGSYIKPASNIRPSLYFVESVDVEEERGTAIRMVDLGLNSHAGEKCIFPLRNNFVVVSPEEAAKILVKEYCNE